MYVSRGRPPKKDREKKSNSKEDLIAKEELGHWSNTEAKKQSNNAQGKTFIINAVITVALYSSKFRHEINVKLFLSRIL
jgi:hypothetical protein